MHPPSGTADFDWPPVLYFYSLYIGVLLIGGLLSVRTSAYGAGLFLMLLYGRYWKNLIRTKIDLPRYCIFLCILIPIVPLISYDEKTHLATLQEFVKYITLHLVILLGVAMPLTPLSQAKRRWILYIVILVFLITGLLWEVALGHRGPRFQGFLPNPNGFALTAMMLLFLTNSDSTPFAIRAGSHILVISLLLLSRTSGALLAYFSGFLYLCFFIKVKNRILGLALLTIALLLFTALYPALPEGTIPAVDNAIEKIALAEENFTKVLEGKKFDYYTIILNRGEDITSGLWRLFQWHQILTLFVNAPLDKFLFGHGIGTTDVLFQLKPHNDYLRILFETGAVGFVFNMTVWILLYLRMDYRYRWVAIMVGVFCFTENNYDHFPAMSLLALYMISSFKITRRERTSASKSAVKTLQSFDGVKI